MKTTLKKTFLDFSKEEEWLNEQGENGLMLIGYRDGEYEFEDVSPAKYQYKIDIPNYTGQKRKDYFDLIEQSGISIVAEYCGRVYLRKNKLHGPLELYTGNVELSRETKKRYSHFVGTGTMLLVFGILFLTGIFTHKEGGDVAFWISISVGTLMIVAAVVLMIAGARSYKKHSVKKEDANIWE